VLDRLDAASIANARLRGIAQLADHPQLTGRGRWGEVGSSAGPLRSLLPPVTVAGREPRLDPIPDVGEHNTALLAELGYDAMPD
jgi:crotonobetainyl-CoA:carnitine CoA-transferase CaiB-like acyl-CoA transferase